MSRFVSIIILIALFFSGQPNMKAAEQSTVEIKSEAALLLDSETGAVLYNKNGEEKLYPASLTKIATAIYAIEHGHLDDIVTVSSRAVNEEGTSVFLVEEEQVPLKKLIQGMLINSGNDAAVAIAEHLDGSVENFANNINSYLIEKIGVKNTHFTNPNGLFNEDHYTTAMDLAIITNYAKKNAVFSEIFGTKELPWIGESWETTLITHHRLLKGEIPYAGITGGKTGFVNESKNTLATTADNGILKLTSIVLKADGNQNAYHDTEALLNYGFNGFHHAIIPANELFKNDEKEFYAGREVIITEPVQGSQRSVNNNGVLSVKNNEQLIQTVELKRKESQPVAIKDSNPMSKEETSNNILYGIAIFAFAGAFIGIRKKVFNRH